MARLKVFAEMMVKQSAMDHKGPSETNVQSTARGRTTGPGQKSRVASMFASTHSGPYLGKRSL